MLYVTILIIRPGRQKSSHTNIYSLIILKHFILRFYHVIHPNRRDFFPCWKSESCILFFFVCMYIQDVSGGIRRTSRERFKLHGCMKSTCIRSDFGGLEVACWPFVPKLRVQTQPKPSDFSGRKNPQHAFLRKGNKAVCPMSHICGM